MGQTLSSAPLDAKEENLAHRIQENLRQVLFLVTACSCFLQQTKMICVDLGLSASACQFQRGRDEKRR